MNSKRKAQALPLNTIVIAMLVIIVLLVIIVFFVNKFTDSGDTMDQQSSSICSISNPAIRSLGYVHAEYSTSLTDKENKCAHDAFEPLKIIPKSEDGAICCATKQDGTWTKDN